jgi:DNA polymerase-3 subunit gamma/tau
LAVKVVSTPAALVAVPVKSHAESRIDAPMTRMDVEPSAEGDFWHTTVQQLIARDAITALVRELALQAQLVARDTDQWQLRVERESLNHAGNRERLTQALQQAGFAVQLSIEVGRVSDNPQRRNAAAAAQKQGLAEKIMHNNPFVQAMMRDFGAKITPGSLKPLAAG